MDHNPLTRRSFLAAIGAGRVSPTNVQTTSDLKVKAFSSTPLIGADGYTPMAYFYRQQLRTTPQITPVFWALRLYGLVETPVTLTHDDLPTLPFVGRACTLACIGSSARNPMIGHARWAGVPVTALLEQVKPTTNAHYAQFYAADGYTTYLETDKLENAILAFEMNGEPLPREHGYPARLIVPGLYGYKMPKWIQRIEFTDTPKPGFWEERGWSVSGDMQTISTILSPHHLETVNGTVNFTGVAAAGARSITAIEISINDSPWMPVPFQAGSSHSWTPWQIDWTPPMPGDYLIKVRATDHTGFTQAEAAPAFPSGPTAIHSVVVRVTQ